MTEWFGETLYPYWAQHHRIERILFREQTGLQDLVIFENEKFGRVLALDGVVQVTEADEFVYHEMLTHVPIFGHGAAEQVLIIGGGDGGILRHALMHPEVRRATMVEIDRGVVDLCTKYMPGVSAGAFDDPRTELVIADGAKFVAETEQKYQVVIIDSTDPAGPGEVLFTTEFYANCKRCLSPGGVIVTQNGVAFMQPEEVTNTSKRLGQVFSDVAFYVSAVPTYVGGLMAHAWGSDDPSLRRVSAAELRRRYDAAGFETRYYTPELHAGVFNIPAYIQKLVVKK